MQQETAVLVMTDAHYGKRTKTFSPEVFIKRLNKVSSTLARLKELLGGGYEFDQLVIAMLGDMNDGTGIFATQSHEQAVSDVEAQAWEFSEHMTGFLKDQAQLWKKVRVECVPGNHGRAGKFAAESANWDRVAYRYMSMKAKEYAHVNYGDGSMLRKIAIRGHHYMLYHGHEIRSFGNIPWYGMLLRMSRWMSTKLAPFDVALMGHFHTSGIWRINKIRMVLGGTMVTDDDWALRTLGWESAPEWWFFGVSTKRAMTWQFPVELI